MKAQSIAAIIGLLVSMSFIGGCRKEADKYPLHYAVKHGEVEKVSTLLGGGADVNAKNDDGDTPLLVVPITVIIKKTGRIDQTLFEKVPVLMETLINKGATINAKNNMGRTLLHLLCERGTDKLVRSLMSKGADVNLQDNNGLTPLCYAISHYHVVIVNYLLEQGALPNTRMTSKENRGKTALDLAYLTKDTMSYDVHFDCYEKEELPDNITRIIDALLQHGAKLSSELE